MAFGALTRVGRDIIILGAGYAAYLASGRDRVLGYTTTEKATQARAGAVG